MLYRGGAEQKIRRYLIDNNFVDCVIQLPANLFFGVSIATCIIVLKKNKQENKTLFIDASAEFIHEGNKNKLTEENIQKILAEYRERKEVPHFSAYVDNARVADNGYNLSVNSYVEQEDTREVIDIDRLEEEIHRVHANVNRLFDDIDRLTKEI